MNGSRKPGTLCRVFFREVADGRGREKKPRPIRSFTKSWRSACRAAGCPGRHPHDLRRTAIRTFVRAGVPERVAMQLSGHRTRSTFERYNIVSSGTRRALFIVIHDPAVAEATMSTWTPSGACLR